MGGVMYACIVSPDSLCRCQVRVYVHGARWMPAQLRYTKCQTRRSTCFSGTPLVSATDETKHIPRGAQRQRVAHSGAQAHGTIEKCQHPELNRSTTGSTPRPMRRLTVYYP